ncbi:hypothetical protein ACLSU7_12200 [Bdellovibrio sp. HCB185ZH]|uniref:hypothetical protein n=1 Tax=Bdellovibrio sp. HCB185ZH TaxID=3394235 RepID=UPI0039A56863
MKKFILLSIILNALSSTVISCGSPPKKETDLASTSPDVEDLADDTALFLNVATRWETTPKDAPQSHKTCAINTLAPLGDVLECTATIPEGQLYYSDVIFSIGTKVAALCPLVSIQFYHYIRSNSATYTPPGSDTSIDCSTKALRSTNKKCWGGAAPQVIDEFPKNTGRYHLTAAGLSTSYTLKSSNSIRWDNVNGGSNLQSTNNLPSALRNAPIAGKYWVDTTSAATILETKMSDYWVTCEDLWAHPLYYIHLSLVDEDTKGQDAVLDEVDDWQ